MSRRPYYDKDMYKPSHELPEKPSALGKLVSNLLVEKLGQAKKDSNKQIAKKEGKRCINFPLFVALDPIEPLDGKDDSKFSRSFVVVILMIAIGIFVLILGTPALKEITKLPTIIVIIIEVIMIISIGVSIITKFIYKVDDNRIKEAKQRGNKSINMASVWGINPGGILEKRIAGKPSTEVYYKGKETIVIKLLKKSVLVSDAMVDWEHYNSLARIDTLLIKNNFVFSKFNTIYDTNNDYIWDELEENMVQSHMLFGEEYSTMMSKFFDFQRKNTMANSSVSIVYYMIKADFTRPEIEFQRLVPEIMSMVRDARCEINPISNKEFLRLIKSYYGISFLDLESIIEGISALNETPVEVNTVSYLSNKGELVKIKDLYTANIKNKYSHLEYYRTEKDIEFLDFSIIDSFSIFGDKKIRQEE